MTREELREHCEKQVENCEMWARCIGEEPHGKIYEEHKLILELLKQEPCEKTISRQAVLDLVVENHTELNGVNVVMYSPLCKDIKQLPPVNPQPKTGHWIRELIRNERVGFSAKMICSICGNDNKHDEYMNYCPNCGAKMVKQQEESEI